jgi:hypothetical protein
MHPRAGHRCSEDSTPLPSAGNNLAPVEEQARDGGGAAKRSHHINIPGAKRSKGQHQQHAEFTPASFPGGGLGSSWGSMKHRISQGLSRLNPANLPGVIMSPGASRYHGDTSQCAGKQGMSAADAAAIKALLHATTEVNINQPAKPLSLQSSQLNPTSGNQASSHPEHGLGLHNKSSASVNTVTATTTPGNTQHGTPPSGGYLAAAAALASGGNSGGSHSMAALPATGSGHRPTGRVMYRIGSRSTGQQAMHTAPVGSPLVSGGMSDQHTTLAIHRDLRNGPSNSLKGGQPPKHSFPALPALRTSMSARQTEGSDRGKSSGSLGEILAIHLPGNQHQPRQISLASLSIVSGCKASHQPLHPPPLTPPSCAACTITDVLLHHW